ncbi:hypothetical protein V1280_003072 [Bradyrhizobium sp. AZCC 2230]
MPSSQLLLAASCLLSRQRSNSQDNGSNRLWNGRVDGLRDEPRSGAQRTIDDARIEAVIARTVEGCPENAPVGVPATWRRPAASHCRRCSASGGPSDSSRIGWRCFKLSTNLSFVAKVCDVVGLLLPPEHAIALRVDEKSPSPGRWTAAMLPMRLGRPARRSHHYARDGSTRHHVVCRLDTMPIPTNPKNQVLR